MNPASEAVSWLRYLAVDLDRSGMPKTAAETRRHANELERYEALRQSLHTDDTCRSCGGPLVNASTGRPRKFCRTCRPPETRRKLRAAGG